MFARVREFAAEHCPDYGDELMVSAALLEIADSALSAGRSMLGNLLRDDDSRSRTWAPFCEAMCVGEHDAWRATSLKAVEDEGQGEVLNWFTLAGAMEELGARVGSSTFVETHVFSSNKVLAVYGTA